MEYMDLNNAEITVTTQHLLDGKVNRDYRIDLSDYGDMGEFLCACSDLFPEENDPEYRYIGWDNIPDRLISHEWICPNFFEIRDALEMLDENEREHFIIWSEHFGYDITTDDPHMMVLHYHDIYEAEEPETETYMEDIFEDDTLYADMYDDINDMRPLLCKILDDNYN